MELAYMGAGRFAGLGNDIACFTFGLGQDLAMLLDGSHGIVSCLFRTAERIGDTLFAFVESAEQGLPHCATENKQHHQKGDDGPDDQPWRVSRGSPKRWGTSART